jgi:hypothetical protein
VELECELTREGTQAKVPKVKSKTGGVYPASLKSHMKTMKPVFGILTTMLALAGQLQAQSFLTNGLVAYYPFDGNVNDASGNGFNLTNYGATLCSDRFGNSNQAYSFNGTSSYIGSLVPPLSQVDNWTMTAWIKPGSTNQTLAFAVCVGYETGSAGDGYAMGISGGQGSGGATEQPGNYLWSFFPGLGYISDSFAFSSTNQWYHVVMLRTNGTLMLYANGAFATNSVPVLSPDQSIATPTAFAIGSGGSSARFFNGAINDVRIFNRALSASEVQELYTDEATPQCATPYAATATATVSDGFVVSATVTDSGCGYSNTPLVQIVGGGGTGATATAVVTNGSVVGIMITDAGSGYVSAPTVLISPPAQCVAHSATAIAVITNGFLISVEITDGGCGYTNAPSIQILGGGGTGAVAVATVTNGEVVSITVTDAGSGYTNTPGIDVSSPLGVLIGIQEAVAPTFSNLSIGSNYQLQASSDLITWTNEGVSFKATNTSMISTQYFNVLNWGQLYFRVQGAP